MFGRSNVNLHLNFLHTSYVDVVVQGELPCQDVGMYGSGATNTVHGGEYVIFIRGDANSGHE